MSLEHIQLDSNGEEEIGSIHLEKKSKDKATHKPAVLLTGKKRQRKLTSGVWVHFDFLDEPDENGNLICKCKKCGNSYNADSKMGTGNLHRHVKNCKMRNFRDVGQMILEKTSSGLENRLPTFNADFFREILALAIVKHDLPFQFVDYDGIRRCFSYLHPDYKSVSPNTIKCDVLKMFKREKEKLKVELGLVSSRIALTSDCWTSITTDGYISLTAHFVDKYWGLQKRILNFCFMPPPHTGVHLCNHVCGLLKEWGIQKKNFSISLDNASSNDVMAENLKGELDLVCGGDFFHVRCCAHIMNLIVQDGLKEIDADVLKVRESVKYFKGSQARKQRFLGCVAHVELQSGKGLKQDVPTRSNSTYLMLDNALYYKIALIHFQKVDANYVHCPSMEEWARIEKFFKFLKVFYEVTLAFSGTKYPNANLYFPNVLRVRLLLKEEMGSSDQFMQRMASRMYEKFGKYWSQFSTFMAIVVVLDPRFKMQFVQWSFKKVYVDSIEYELELSKVKDKLKGLYEAYVTSYSSSIKDVAARGHGEHATYDTACDEFMMDFDSFSTEQSSVATKSEMELYYDEPLIPRTSNINILDYWRTNSVCYPILAQLAKDVLAVPISTVASESTFSAGGRVLDCFRSSLKPSTVEAIICLRDWTFGEVNMDPQLETLCGTIMKPMWKRKWMICHPHPHPHPIV